MKTFKSLVAIAVLAAFLPNPALAERKSIEQLMTLNRSTGDRTYASRAAIRCAGLYMHLAAIALPTHPAVSEQYVDGAIPFAMLGLYFDKEKHEERTSAPFDMREGAKNNRHSVELAAEMYEAWTNQNAIEGGDMINAEIKQDIAMCQRMAALRENEK